MISDPQIPIPSTTRGSLRVALVAFNFGEYCLRLASALCKQAEILLLLPEEHALPYPSLLDSAVTLQTFEAPRCFLQLATMHYTPRKDFSADLFHHRRSVMPKS